MMITLFILVLRVVGLVRHDKDDIFLGRDDHASKVWLSPISDLCSCHGVVYYVLVDLNSYLSSLITTFVLT